MKLRAHPLLIAAIALIALPILALACGFTWGIATEMAILALAAIAFNVLLGYTGLLSFGHGLFFGLSAYATVLSQLHLFPGSMLLPALTGVLIAMIAGLVVGFFALRRRGVYFSLLTLAFTALAFYVVYRWTDFTGGENGLSGLKRQSLLGIDLENTANVYWVIATIVFIALVLLWRIVRSPLGTVLCAIREHETRTRFIGYPVAQYKLAAFTLSATFTGLAGVLMAYLKLFVSADVVHINFSGEILAMTIFGGTGEFLGPALGAIVFVTLREWLSGYTAAWQFWFGLAFMAFILFSPEGLVGIGARVLGPLLAAKKENAAMSARQQPVASAPAPQFLTAHPRSDAVLLEVRALTKSFGGFKAVSDANLSIRDRTLHALIGPNGAGKTTLFNTIAGMFVPDSGHITLAGDSISGLGAHRVVGKGLAKSFQITSVFQSLTVWENMRLACQARDPMRLRALRGAASLDKVNTEARELIEFLGLRGLEETPVSSLSYGGQRLVEIGLALATQPKMLLLDEPLVGLSAAERERVSQLIRGLSQHMAVLLVEHDIDRVFALADVVTVMNEGQVLVEGDAATVRAHPTVQRVYLGEGIHVAPPEDKPTASATQPLLQIESIDTFYGKSHILRAVSFEVHEGEVLALLGRNGAGKSSTFKSILGLATPASGRILFAGTDIVGKTTESIARAGIGLVPQGRRLFSGLTVEENWKLGALSRGKGAGTHWTQDRIFERFPKLKQRWRTSVELLSGGEQQMVAIARALAGNVRVLLMDEPFEGLSPAMVEEVYRAIANLKQELAIVIIEHHLDLVLGLADRAVVLDRGAVAHTGLSKPLRDDLELRRRVLWV